MSPPPPLQLPMPILIVATIHPYLHPLLAPTKPLSMPYIHIHVKPNSWHRYIVYILYSASSWSISTNGYICNNISRGYFNNQPSSPLNSHPNMFQHFLLLLLRSEHHQPWPPHKFVSRSYYLTSSFMAPTWHRHSWHLLNSQLCTLLTINHPLYQKYHSNAYQHPSRQLHSIISHGINVTLSPVAHLQ